MMNALMVTRRTILALLSMFVVLGDRASAELVPRLIFNTSHGKTAQKPA
jgi:hypothetical protein